MNTIIYDRLNFKINSKKTHLFKPGKTGKLINKNGIKIPYKIINCKNGAGTILIPRSLILASLPAQKIFKIYED
jgi:hypothetical protein